MGKIKLFSFLDGGDIDKPFPIDVDKAQTIGDLKSLVKNELRPVLDNIAAAKLAAYKVKVPAGDPMKLQRAIDDIDPMADRLSPWDAVGEIFCPLAPKHVHLIIRTPSNSPSSHPFWPLAPLPVPAPSYSFQTLHHLCTPLDLTPSLSQAIPYSC